jgi:hypothetical protein
LQGAGGTESRIAAGPKQPLSQFQTEKLVKNFFTVCVDFVVIRRIITIPALFGGMK